MSSTNGIVIEHEAPTEESTPKAPKPKPDGRIGTLEKQVAELREQLGEVRWCFAELIHNAKMAIVQQLLAAGRNKEAAAVLAEM